MKNVKFWLSTIACFWLSLVHAATLDTDEWLAQHNTVRVGVPTNLMPLIGIESGDGIGFDADMLRLITQKLPLTIKWQNCGSWSRCLKALEQREIDILPSMSYSEDRSRYTSFTQRYWSMPWAVLYRNKETLNARGSVNVGDLRGQRLGIIQDYSVVSLLRNQRGTEVIEYDNIEQATKALKENQINVYVDSLPILVYELQNHPITHANLEVLDDAPGQDLFFGVRSDWQPLVVTLNRGIDNITQSQQNQLRNKWYGYELQTGWSDEELIQVALKVGSGVVLVFLFIAFRNSRLRREVKLRKDAEKRIRYVATHDELTGLPNRKLLSDRLEQAMLQAERSNKAFAIMFLDLDGFKQINDKYGHEVGDELLIHASQRMQSMLRRSDTVCRYGGDEFVILLPTTPTTSAALAVARKLVVHIARPYQIGTHMLEVSTSIGVSLFPQHGSDENALLRAADKAMYAAKDAGKNDVRLAAP
mgnify:FL=1|jgi:diguanylate cyclase (GGDEF)-like protein